MIDRIMDSHDPNARGIAHARPSSAYDVVGYTPARKHEHSPASELDDQHKLANIDSHTRYEILEALVQVNAG